MPQQPDLSTSCGCFLFFTGLAGLNGALEVAEERKENQKTCCPLGWGGSSRGTSQNQSRKKTEGETREKQSQNLVLLLLFIVLQSSWLFFFSLKHFPYISAFCFFSSLENDSNNDNIFHPRDAIYYLVHNRYNNILWKAILCPFCK